MAVERDGAEEFLALGVAGIVRAGVGLLLGEIDLLADAARDFLAIVRRRNPPATCSCSARVNAWRRRRDTNVSPTLYPCSDQVEPELLLGRDFLAGESTAITERRMHDVSPSRFGATPRWTQSPSLIRPV